MIATGFDDAFSQEWVETQMTDSTNELVILRQVIPWQAIISQLIQFYDRTKGRLGTSLRLMVAIVIVARLRQLSDREVVRQVKENRYMQYFCNVPDAALVHVVDPSTLCRFRHRLGEQGIALIEAEVFERLRRAGILQGETLLMDSTVLASDIIYPNDVQLVYKAFEKMTDFAESHFLPLWWDHAHIKARWRAFGLAKPTERPAYLAEFAVLFTPALVTFRTHVESLATSSPQQEHERRLVQLLSLLETQTQQKLTGQRHIENRLVSLEDLDARPIKKGKAHPTCEFGTTLQMTFNRQGFMITTENFIGKPDDTTLYPGTLERFKERMQVYPDTVVTDLGFRSRANFTIAPALIAQVFLGRSEDVTEIHQDFCRKARSATEGFIAVAKQWRGFGRSRYRGLQGHRTWTLLNQTAYNLKKFLQLYRQVKLTASTVSPLGLRAA